MSNVALCVGVNYYEYANCLDKCVEDAWSVAKALERNGDDSVNFEVIRRFAMDEKNPISKHELRSLVEQLFSEDHETALFYFAGHGAVNDYGGYLCTSDVAYVDDGLSMDVLMQIVAKSPARNKIIILDSCHSGALGNISLMEGFCKLPPNTTILAASTDNNVAYEGVFTPLLVDALEGGATNLVGEVTPGSVYSYIDRALGTWYQRPVFKANIKNFVCLRKAAPPISLKNLHRLTELFPAPDYEFPLDPTYEEDKNHTENKEVSKENEAIFEVLRKFNQLNLLKPVKEEYMYWAAVHSDSLKLTAQGQYYWGLVRNRRI